MIDRPLLAMMPIPKPIIPDATALMEALHKFWPQHPKLGRAAETDQNQNVVSLEIGDDILIVTLIPSPIPWSDLEGPCQAAWYYWPEAASVVQDHEAHLLVLLRSEDEKRTEAAIRLSEIVRVLAALVQPVAILWGGSGRIHQPEAFIKALDDRHPGFFPVELWIGFTLIQENDGTHSIYTDGLEEFGLREIEVHRTHREPQHLYARTFDIAHYVLKNDVHFKDGETIGFSEEEKFVIHHGPSRAEPENEVTILEM